MQRPLRRQRCPGVPFATIQVGCVLLTAVVFVAVYLIRFWSADSGVSAMLLRRRARGVAPSVSVAALDYPTERCRERSPECVTERALAGIYGVRHSATRSYAQAICCERHPQIREAVEFVIPYYQGKGVPITVAHGSALGIARHHHQQVPWTLDADLDVILDFVPEFNSSNFDRVLMSLNDDLDYSRLHGGRFQIFRNLREGERNTSWFRIEIDGFSAVDIFVLIGLSADVPWPERRLYNRRASWRSIQPSIPYAHMLPLGNCQFYDMVLGEGCPRDMAGYLQTMYGPGFMRGPNYFKDGADITKQTLFLAAKQHECIVFLSCYTVWACLVCALWHAKRKQRGRGVRPTCSFVLAVACGLPLILAIGYMWYVSKYVTAYSLGINYGVALAELVAPGWFVDINTVH